MPYRSKLNVEIVIVILTMMADREYKKPFVDDAVIGNRICFADYCACNSVCVTEDVGIRRVSSS